MAMHAIFILFVFALGACVGSFLNVVVWRLPRDESLVSPPSHCPKCQHRLAWYDNIPVFGWILLGGKCRYCREAISSRYPIIEFVTGAMFAFYYIAFFMHPVLAIPTTNVSMHLGPCVTSVAGVGLTGDAVIRHEYLRSLPEDWPIYGLYMVLISGLLAASLIDAELMIIPLEIPWLLAAVGILAHAIIDRPSMPGALNLASGGPGGTGGTGEMSGALAAGGAVGLLVSMGLFMAGKMPVSFPNGEPGGELDEESYQAERKLAAAEGRAAPERPVEYTPGQIRGEMRKEMLFLLPPMIGALLAIVLVRYVPAIAAAWQRVMMYDWVSGLLGAVLGAMVGGLVVWLARILGTLAFGRVAMGLGDVHLMFGVGAIVGAGPATVAFFLAPFAGLAMGLWMLITRSRRELPYGPYLSLATAVVLLIYCPIADYLRPGMMGLEQMLQNVFGA